MEAELQGALYFKKFEIIFQSIRKFLQTLNVVNDVLQVRKISCKILRILGYTKMTKVWI
jgi:hypothetical protein